MSTFEPGRREVVFTGRVIQAGTEWFRFDDGEEVSRDTVWHPGAVGILAVDATHVWLVRQPREVASMSESLEIPAGKLDIPGEPPDQTARRELVEEIGKEAGSWREIHSFYSSPGFTDERIWLYLATDLRDAPGGAAPEDDERITVVPWPLDELDSAVAECRDSKSLIALLWLKSHPTSHT
jgi:8-oxo-dGTP pyrophosphatase MutT (NUDIX family)